MKKIIESTGDVRLEGRKYFLWTNSQVVKVMDYYSGRIGTGQGVNDAAGREGRGKTKFT